MPLIIFQILQHAINARKRCYLSFQSSEEMSLEIVSSNKRHEHFTDVLENAMNILQPCEGATAQSVRDWRTHEPSLNATKISLLIKDTKTGGLNRRQLEKVLVSITQFYMSSASDIQMPVDAIYIERHNPLYAPLEELKLTMDMEKAAHDYADISGFFVAVAHLYNAAKRLRFLDGFSREAMGTAIDMHLNLLFKANFQSSQR